MKRIRFSLRSMMVLFALCSVCFGSLAFYTRKSQLQRQMVASLNSRSEEGWGVSVLYDTWLKWNSKIGQYESDLSKRDGNGNFKLNGLEAWIHSNLGVDFIDRPAVVIMSYQHTQELPEITDEVSGLIQKLEIREIQIHKVMETYTTSSVQDMITWRNVVTQKELQVVRDQFPNLTVAVANEYSRPTR